MSVDVEKIQKTVNMEYDDALQSEEVLLEYYGLAQKNVCEDETEKEDD